LTLNKINVKIEPKMGRILDRNMKKLTLTSILICLSFFSAFSDQLAGGADHSLALKADGTVWAWGWNGDGQLGDGTTEDRLVPVQVSGLTDVISISAGWYHSLALKQDGIVWAWGYNSWGQLGNGTTTPYYMPNPAPGQMIGLSGVIAIAGGGCHSLLLKSDGTVWACGMNRNGQVGDGTTTDRNTPVQVRGLSGVISIAGGGEHSLALKSDGTVWAWGWNVWGQLGDGNGGGEMPYTNCYSALPVQAIGLSNIIAIAGGLVHSIALKNDGTVWGWGFNAQGQLGDGTTSNRYTPVQVSGLSGVIAIAGGEYYSISLASYGTVWIWGQMEWGGNIWSTIPVSVNGISGVKGIGASGSHALALKNGTVWAWGKNNSGQLGDGSTISRYYPVQVQGLSLGTSSPPSSVMAADFDADGKADPIAVQAPSTGSTSSPQASSGQAVNAWYYWHSSQSYSREGPISLGMSGQPAAGDVDGDGIGDMALTDSSGNWFFWLSSHNYSVDGPYAFGIIGTPILGDFDGDRKADPAIVDASEVWHVWLSGDGYSPASAAFAVAGATPLTGDFDADGKSDPVMMSATGAWYLWLSGSMYSMSGPYNFGLSGKPVAGDFDGDGKADPAIMDSSGNWNFWMSGSFYTRSGPYYLVLP
jgi:alpha-tubulin suppressor-like RCC1 family protein